MAEGIAARPGWAALMFPTIPLGTEGVNETVGKYAYPGTYTVRPSTLRAVYMDLADDLGEQGFRWIFVLSVHGSLSHNNVLHDVERSCSTNTKAALFISPCLLTQTSSARSPQQSKSNGLPSRALVLMQDREKPAGCSFWRNISFGPTT